MQMTLHWLPVAARITFKSPTLAYKTAPAPAPAYLNSIIQGFRPGIMIWEDRWVGHDKLVRQEKRWEQRQEHKSTWLFK